LVAWWEVGKTIMLYSVNNILEAVGNWKCRRLTFVGVGWRCVTWCWRNFQVG